MSGAVTENSATYRFRGSQADRQSAHSCIGRLGLQPHRLVENTLPQTRHLTAAEQNAVSVTPAVVLFDTGLSAHLLSLDDQRLQTERTLLDPLMEAFVTLELLKASAWSAAQPGLYHDLTHTGQEVDVLLEHPDGRLVDIEVKATASPGPSDFRGQWAVQADFPERFHRGVEYHLGERATPFGERLHALPVSALWQWH